MNLTHIDERLLIGYWELSVTAATAASIEAHLMTCTGCRAALANVGSAAAGGLVDQRAVWDAVLERVDQPRRSITERLLGALHVRADTAKLLATTPALRLAWLTAVVFVAILASVAARVEGDGPWLLLVIAPLLPLAGVATAYGPAMDPTYEIGVAAPTSGLRLVLLRTLAVVLTTTPLLAISALVTPAGGWAAFGWVLPSLALVAMTLAVSTVTSPERAAAIVGSGWLVVLIVLVDRGGTGDFVENSLVFSSLGQSTATVVTAIGLAIVATRKNSFDLMTVSGGQR